jgi:hypothetical protein
VNDKPGRLPQFERARERNRSGSPLRVGSAHDASRGQEQPEFSPTTREQLAERGVIIECRCADTSRDQANDTTTPTATSRAIPGCLVHGDPAELELVLRQALTSLTHEHSKDRRPEPGLGAQGRPGVLPPSPPTKQWLKGAARALRARLRRPNLETTIVLIVAAAVAVVRFVVLNGAAPATIDSGNWLSFAESWFSDSSRDSSITYPPVVPALTELFTRVFGLSVGIAVLGALAATAPALGAHYALGAAGAGRLRVVPVLLLLGAGSIGEAAAWGGFPQLIAMGILPVALLATLHFLDTPSRRTALWLGALLATMMAVSHFVALVGIVSVVAAIEIDTIIKKRVPITRAHLRHTHWLMLPAIPLVTVYVKLVRAVVLEPNEFATLDNLTWGNALSRLDALYPEFPSLWQLLIPLALATPLFAWALRHTLGWRIVTSLLLAITNLTLLTRESRYLYFVPIIAVLSFGVWAGELLARRPWADERRLIRTTTYALGAIVAVSVGVQLQSGLDRFGAQRDFYAVLSPGVVEAIHVAGDATTTARPVIALPSLHDAPLGWWVEALTDDPVLYGSPLRWLNFSAEVEQAATANAIFHPTFPDSETMDLLDASDVGVLVIPRRWAWFDAETVADWIGDHDLQIVANNRDAMTVVVP